MSSETAGPTRRRIEVIDAIRGFALLGIVVANIQSWSGYRFLPYTEIAQLPAASWDAALWSLQKFFIEAKFYALFSMLFGVGFWLQYDRNREREAEFMPIYRRRLGFLLLFGVLHALVWSGDILTLYALVGFVFVLFRNLKPSGVLASSLACFTIFIVPNTIMMFVSPGEPDVPDLARKVYPDMSPEAVVSALRDGSLAEVFRVNLHNLAWRWFDFLPSGRIGRVLGLFLLGYWLAGRGFFSERASDPRRLLLFASLGTVLTLAGMYTTGSLSRWPSSPTQLFDNLLTTAGQVTLALAYACLIAVIFRRPFGRRLLEPLTLVGRLAFTSYLMQTLIGVTLFYGVGFGLCGSVPLAWLMPLAVAIYAFQVLFASRWLARYRFGPVEWVWRCLTYGERFPNRR